MFPGAQLESVSICMWGHPDCSVSTHYKCNWSKVATEQAAKKVTTSQLTGPSPSSTVSLADRMKKLEKSRSRIDITNTGLSQKKSRELEMERMMKLAATKNSLRH